MLNDLAVLHHINGEYPQAFATFEQALDTARRGSNTRVETMVLIGLGDLFLDLDAPETALDAYRQARDRVEHSKDHFLNIYQYTCRSVCNSLAQRTLSALRGLLQAAEQLMGPTPLNYTQGLWLLESGQLALAENHNSRAKEHFAQAALLFEASDQRILAGRANLLLAGALFALHETEDAESFSGKSFSNRV